MSRILSEENSELSDGKQEKTGKKSANMLRVQLFLETLELLKTKKEKERRENLDMSEHLKDPDCHLDEQFISLLRPPQVPQSAHYTGKRDDLCLSP